MKSPKLTTKFKMADFLLGLSYGSKRLFCAPWHDTCVYFCTCKFNMARGVLCLNIVGGAVEPFFHTYVSHLYNITDFKTFRVAKFCEFSSMSSPLKIALLCGKQCVAMATAFKEDSKSSVVIISKVLFLG